MGWCAVQRQSDAIRNHASKSGNNALIPDGCIAEYRSFLGKCGMAVTGCLACVDGVAPPVHQKVTRNGVSKTGRRLSILGSLRWPLWPLKFLQARSGSTDSVLPEASRQMGRCANQPQAISRSLYRMDHPLSQRRNAPSFARRWLLALSTSAFYRYRPRYSRSHRDSVS